jgi:hypothetical protein
MIFVMWHYVYKNSNYNYSSLKLNIKTPFEVQLNVLYLTFYLQKLELQYITINPPQSFYCSCFVIRMLNGEYGSMNVNRWAWSEQDQSFLEYFVNIQRISKEYSLTWHIIYHDVEEYFTTCTWMNDNYGWTK